MDVIPGRTRQILIFLVLCFPLTTYCQWTQISVVDTTTPNLRGQRNQATDVRTDGTLGVVWVEETSDRKNPIVFMKSNNQGSSFQKLVVIDSVLREKNPFSSLPGESRTVHDFKFGPDGTIWVLWSHFLEYDFSVQAFLRLSKSTDGGTTFSQVFNAPRASTTFIPQLAIGREGTVFMFWDDQQFKCTRFLNGDISKRLDASIGPSQYTIDSNAGIAVDSSFNVYCVWNGFRYDSTNALRAYIFSSVSRDSGKTFLPFIRVNSNESSQWAPKIAATNSGLVFVTYRTYVGQHASGGLINDVMFARSTDGANSFEPSLTLMDSIVEGGLDPRVIYKPATGVLTSWTFSKWLGGFNYRTEGYVSRSTNLGIAFPEPVSIDSATYRPVLSADDRGNVYAFLHTSAKGIHFSKTNVVTDVPDQRNWNVPRQFTISQNYPNPFNPSTNIKYEVPLRGRVEIKVFDLVGRVVTTLVDQIEEPGTKTIRFEYATLPSGVYFYRILSDTFVETKKMILLR